MTWKFLHLLLLARFPSSVSSGTDIQNKVLDSEKLTLINTLRTNAFTSCTDAQLQLMTNGCTSTIERISQSTLGWELLESEVSLTYGLIFK